MKTTKVLFLATLLVLSSVSITIADGIGQKKSKSKIIHVTMVQALAVPGLPAAMLQQLDQEQLIGCGCASSYTADVTLGNLVYRITGTQQEWTVFFNWGGMIVEDDNNIIL
jgi:hypothetical protein